MVDFVQAGVTLTPNDNETFWRGGPGSFIVDTGGTTVTLAKLQASFDTGIGAMDIDPALSLTGIIAQAMNFELPPCRLSVVVTAGGGSFDLVSARPITEGRFA